MGKAKFEGLKGGLGWATGEVTVFFYACSKIINLIIKAIASCSSRHVAKRLSFCDLDMLRVKVEYVTLAFSKRAI